MHYVLLCHAAPDFGGNRAPNGPPRAASDNNRDLMGPRRLGAAGEFELNRNEELSLPGITSMPRRRPGAQHASRLNS